MRSGDGGVYAKLTPTLEVERLLPIDPQLKEKTVQSSMEKRNNQGEEVMAKILQTT